MIRQPQLLLGAAGCKGNTHSYSSRTRLAVSASAAAHGRGDNTNNNTLAHQPDQRQPDAAAAETAGYRRWRLSQLGLQLLQQAPRDQPPRAAPSLGQLLLEQPRIIRQPQRALQGQQPQHQPQQSPQQPQQHQHNPPQLSQRGVSHDGMVIMPPQEALTASDGFTVSRRERYMAPEAAQLQGRVLPAATQQDMQDISAVASLLDEVFAEVAAAAAAHPGSSTDVSAVFQQRLQQTQPGHSRMGMAIAPALLELVAAPPAPTQQQLSSSSAAGSDGGSGRGNGGRGAQADSLPQHQTTSRRPLERLMQARRRRRTSLAGQDSNSSSSSKGSGGGGDSIQQAGCSPSQAAAQTLDAPPAQPLAPESATGTDTISSSSSSSANTSSGRRRRSTTISSNSNTITSSRRTRSATSSSTSTSSWHTRIATANSTSSTTTSSTSTSTRSSQEQQLPPLSEDEVLLQLLELLEGEDIVPPPDAACFGQHSRLLCPMCAGGDKQELSFSLKLERSGSAVWHCFRAKKCGWSGRVAVPGDGLLQRHRRTSSSSGSSSSTMVSLQPPSKPLLSAVPADIAAQLRPLTPQVVSFFAARGISPAVLVRNRVSTALDRWGRPTVIALPYYVGSTLVNIKYRTLDKRFSQVKGGQQVLYGLNDLQGADSAIIVEGELDKLAIESATGNTAVVSLPAGAIATPDPNNKKLACIDAAAAQLMRLQRIVIAVDGDEPGWATAQALYQKLHALKQRRHTSTPLSISQRGALKPPPPQQQQQPQLQFLFWPASQNYGGRETLQYVSEEAQAAEMEFDVEAAAGCKDANDVLMRCGAAALSLYMQLGCISDPQQQQ